jgi:exopolysaccharide biosynthesis protein
LPFGLTTPEVAAVMGALGARRAVLLDGGISSQLLIREGTRTLR